MTAQKGSRYSSTLSLTSALDWGCWSTPRSGRFTAGKDSRYLLYRRLNGPPGPVWREEENLALPGIGSPDRPARSKTLYRLRYPGLPNQLCSQYKSASNSTPFCEWTPSAQQRKWEVCYPPERQVSLTRVSWNLNSELLTAYSTLTFTCTAIIDTSPRALCGSIKIRTIVQLNSWAQPLSSLSSMSLFPVAQYQDNPLHFLGR